MKRTFLSITGCILAALAFQSAGQDFPTRPVKIVVPYAAGGVPDVIARAVGQRLTEIFSQQVLVENKGGGAGIAAVMSVVGAAPDGYTMIMSDAQQYAINAYLISNLPYDTLRDTVPVTNVANSIQFVVASPSVKIDSFTDLVAYAKANPGKLSYGTAGVGSVHHIAMESIKASLGLDLVHVPYKGSGQSVPAFLAGEVPIVLASLPALVAHVKAGKAKLIAVTAASRSAQAPEVPAVAEYIPGYDFTTGIGLLAPAGTPPAIVNRISAAVGQALKNPDLTARLVSLGLDPVGSTPEAFTALIRKDLARYSTAVKLSGAKIN